MLEYFYQALAAPSGIALTITSGDRESARQRLYAARREAADPSLASISIAFHPTDPTQLWLVKNGKESNVPPEV